LHTPGQPEERRKIIQPDSAPRKSPPRPPCEENRSE
jgi:hypothetical protein